MAGDGHFRQAVAATDDDDERPMFDPPLVAATVDLLARLAGGGHARAFAIGTGPCPFPPPYNRRSPAPPTPARVTSRK